MKRKIIFSVHTHPVCHAVKHSLCLRHHAGLECPKLFMVSSLYSAHFAYPIPPLYSAYYSGVFQSEDCTHMARQILPW